MEARVQNLAEVLQVEALVGGGVADAHPRDVALPDVLNARRAVDEVVDLPLQHRLEVLLHLAARHLDDDAHIHVALRRDRAEVRPDHFDLAVGDGVQIGHVQILEAARMLAAELDAHIVLAHDFALKRRAVRHGHGHVGHFHFDAAHFDALLHQRLGAFQIVLARNLVERHRHDVLVSGDARRQDFGDDGIGDDGEAKVDGARRRRVFQIVHFAEREHEREHAILVVVQNLARHAALHAAKRQRRSGGEAQRVDRAQRVGAERHGERIVTEFDAFFLQLMDDAAAVDVAREEREDAAALQLPNDLHGDFVRSWRTRRWPRNRACAHRRVECPTIAVGCRRSGR